MGGVRSNSANLRLDGDSICGGQFHRTIADDAGQGGDSAYVCDRAGDLNHRVRRSRRAIRPYLGRLGPGDPELSRAAIPALDGTARLWRDAARHAFRTDGTLHRIPDHGHIGVGAYVLHPRQLYDRAGADPHLRGGRAADLRAAALCVLGGRAEPRSPSAEGAAPKEISPLKYRHDIAPRRETTPPSPLWHPWGSTAPRFSKTTGPPARRLRTSASAKRSKRTSPSARKRSGTWIIKLFTTNGFNAPLIGPVNSCWGRFPGILRGS